MSEEPKPQITQEQFEADYATGSGMSLEQMHAYGLRAERCDCNYPKCRGWRMVSHKVPQ